MTTFYIESVRFQPYPVAWQQFRTSKSQPIGKDLYKRGLKLQALARKSAPKDTGALAKSISVKYHIVGLNPHVIVGAYTSYAYMVHEGTRPHPINAKPERLLRFVVNGRVVYAKKVQHPGTRPTRYLSRHLRSVVK